MPLRRFPAFWLLVLIPAASAITVHDSRISATVSERECLVPKSTTTFQPTARQAFLWFAARQVRPQDQLRVEWLDPSGAIATRADYTDLSATAQLCFASQLPIAGFGPASQPGVWTARVIANERQLASQQFTIVAAQDTGGPQVTSVTWSGVRASEIDFTVNGSRFEPGSLVLIAEYTRSDGWKYIATLQPRTTLPNQLLVHYTGLPANEYLVIVESPDQKMSAPMPFVIETGGYKLPIPAGVPWIVTQGPHGTFSHWGNSLHAYDIAPQSARCVVAMRAGVVYTHDLGLRQDHLHHSFGNYITIDHGNGEYSHYAHLQSGTFTVQNGQKVEQGQALAIAGNSGYTLGEGGGYHVHVSVTRALAISAPSIPFRFDDLADGRAAKNRAVVSTNSSALCDCDRPRPGLASRWASSAPQFTGEVAVEGWWSQTVQVPRGAASFDVMLAWSGAGNDLDLHLVSPSGRHYGWYGDPTGYSGNAANPEEFRLVHPEPGLWRVSVQGMRSANAGIPFELDTTGLRPDQIAAAPVHRAALHR